MPSEDKQHLDCDLLLFVATSSEKKALKFVAKELGLLLAGKHVEGVGRFKTMGSVGSSRVNVFETSMGTFGYEGSSATAMRDMTATHATGII